MMVWEKNWTSRKFRGLSILLQWTGSNPQLFDKNISFASIGTLTCCWEESRYLQCLLQIERYWPCNARLHGPKMTAGDAAPWQARFSASNAFFASVGALTFCHDASRCLHCSFSSLKLYEDNERYCCLDGDVSRGTLDVLSGRLLNGLLAR